MQYMKVTLIALPKKVRYDNERGKGDHRHVGEVQSDYEFISLDALLADFERDVTNWR